jgi:competence protein ComEA
METNKYSEIFSKLVNEVKAADDNRARLLILFRKPLVILVICFLAILLLQWYKSTIQQNGSQAAENTVQVSAQGFDRSPNYIYVDLSGSVVDPKVHRVPVDTRLFEILSASGGLNELADRPYFYRNFNLAMVLHDQDKIYVPSVNEVVNGIYLENNKLVSAYNGKTTTQVSQPASDGNGRISINTASQALLETLKGVGTITASRIIAGRPYKTVNELVEKDILKDALFDSVKDQLDL